MKATLEVLGIPCSLGPMEGKDRFRCIVSNKIAPFMGLWKSKLVSCAHEYDEPH